MEERQFSAELEGLEPLPQAQAETSALEEGFDAQEGGPGQGTSGDRERGQLDPLEEMRRRNAGLQRRLQKELEEKRLLEQRLRQLEEAVLYQSLSHLPPEERQRRVAEYRRERELSEREAALRQLQEERERMAKEQVIQILSQRYGVPPEELRPFDSPEEMEYYAKAVARRARFEPTEGAPTPRKVPKNLDEAAEVFRRIASRYRVT